MRAIVGVVAGLAALVLGACTAKMSSDITVGGEKFEPTECRSGQAFGFTGVQLTDKTGRRIRLAPNVDGTVSILFFDKGQDVGHQVPSCGTMQISQQNSEINGIKNVQGKATLGCTDGDTEIKGSISFENCH